MYIDLQPATCDDCTTDLRCGWMTHDGERVIVVALVHDRSCPWLAANAPKGSVQDVKGVLAHAVR